jgi:hypothetical protein
MRQLVVLGCSFLITAGQATALDYDKIERRLAKEPGVGRLRGPTSAEARTAGERSRLTAGGWPGLGASPSRPDTLLVTS